MATGSASGLDHIAVEMPAPQVNEHPARAISGWAMLAVSVVVTLGGLALLWWGIVRAADGTGGAIALITVGALVTTAGAVLACGLTPVAPGEARVVQLLGRYTGTIRTDGLRWVNPFTRRHRVSTRIRNHETDKLKVNDADGNPIEIAAVVVWQVEDTAKAVFEVDDFMEFVAAEEITGLLSAEIGARVASAGVRVIESRLTRLAYAPEIAQAMLRRQQATAVVAARQRIVDGAVGMVESALARLDEQDVVELDEERKAAMVSNLLVVLCSDHAPQPVVNAGSLYH
jgi:regulator of protease activity HflC (stomatin/prohibitin superfamily)